MKITVNGESRDIAATTLDAALAELGYGEARVATAVNEGFVPSAARPGTTLSEGDRVEILAPRQGG
ncbi:sulfur carrier protein ThiS [Salipiger mucosus]|uniref:Thiamine biosynthesis protein ThiS n=1 Tax=Salipiger mucosus DSM 16094 TaxID=1123237 RepID=S9Q5Z0_9RHOB|nr:sulfur carrier protein ThiS [Salipiger mucosus]EPX75462.1 thiamine biosynthesis protein ThiS [Salipiger mucosus DSM 16094]